MVIYYMKNVSGRGEDNEKECLFMDDAVPGGFNS